MKLAKIATLFKKNALIITYRDTNGEQWIGNGEAIYSMRGMPYMSIENILKMFDVPEDKWEDWQNKAQENISAEIDFRDEAIETEIEHMKVDILYNDTAFWQFHNKSDGHIYAVKADYIKPLLDKPEYIRFFHRKASNGGTLIAVKNGLKLEAIILPKMLCFDKHFLDELRDMERLYKSDFLLNSAYKNKQDYKQAEAEAEEDYEQEAL